MGLPPATPSPRRFLINKPTPTGPRRPIVGHLEQAVQDATPVFRATPRFSYATSQRDSEVEHANFPQTSGVTHPAIDLLHVIPKVDAIEESFSQPSLPLHDSIEADEPSDEENSFQDEEEWGRYVEGGRDGTEGPAPKRQRLSTTPAPPERFSPVKNENADFVDLLSSSIPLLSSPHNKRDTRSSKARRFVGQTPAPRLDPVATEQPNATFLQPPRFCEPSPASASQELRSPLPDQFSPHRRGQKYIPGGLASEVRGWLVSLENGGGPFKAEKNDGYVVRVLVDEVASGGASNVMSSVRGRQVHSAATFSDHVNGSDTTKTGASSLGIIDELGVMNVLLAGEGASEGLAKGDKVEAGVVVGIKAPVWEIVLDGIRWGVGVNWKVLKS